jgi:BMFP domain-containing protein YqiC
LTTGEKPKHPTIFRFENCWFLRPDLKQIIADEWNKEFRGRNIEDVWQKRMRNMRQNLQGWNRNVEGKNRKLKKDLLVEIDKLDRLSELDGLTAQNRVTQIQLQQQLRLLIREEEVKWIQRVKELELKEGDINSKYYHQKQMDAEGKNYC